ncbi:MAG: hypothetical protein LBQ74_05100 [Prevotella sp.]|jgi:hypothetical protein|nr:hypothetical protein [Prevotella sp.]
MSEAKKVNLKIAAKYFPQKEREKTDTVNGGTFEKNDHVLTEAYTAWSALDKFRNNARRNKKYTFEDQWGDHIRVGCKTVTERQHILNQGGVPLQNNRMRSIMRSVVGVFQSTQTEPVCVSRDRDEQGKGEMMSATLQYVYQLNKLWGLDSVNLQHFLFSGIGIFKSVYGWRNGKMDVWNDLVNYNDFFVDPDMKDPRHTDCHLVGQLHDKSIHQVMAQFAGGCPQKAGWIRDIYGRCRDGEATVSYVADTLHQDINESKDFFMPANPAQCRVIEIWRKEYKERLLVHDTLTGEFYKEELTAKAGFDTENGIRIQQQAAQGIAPGDMRLIQYKWFIDEYWYFYYMTPQGDVLKEGETPYWHESHPFSFKIYPFIDGQAFPFIGDFIDQQRYINRLITLQDFVMLASAKGVLLFPEDSLPTGYTMDDIADSWAVYNGVIAYKPAAHGKIPQQVIANSSQTGAYDMLSIQLKLLEDISGVQGALQGKAPAAGTPASLYLQQTQNSTTSLTEIYEAFRELREERDMKNMKLIQQFYPDRKYINLNRNNASPKSIVYDANLVRDAEMDLNITESTSTPAYRMVMNDFLMQMFQLGQIDIEMLLENGSFPFADKLLQSVKAKRLEAEQAQQAMMQGQAVQPPSGQEVVPPEIRRQIAQNTNPLIQSMLNRNNNIAS